MNTVPSVLQFSYLARALTYRDERAFTLIELLIVILVLGILLAIALPTFLNQQNKAKDSDAKLALNTAYKVAKSDATSNNDKFRAPAALVAAINQSEPQLQAEQIDAPEDASESKIGVVSSSNRDLRLATLSKSGALCQLVVENGRMLDGGPTCGESAGGPGDDQEAGDDQGGGNNGDTETLLAVRTVNMGEGILYRAEDDGTGMQDVFTAPPGHTEPGLFKYDAAENANRFVYWVSREGFDDWGMPDGYEGRLAVANLNNTGHEQLPNPCEGSQPSAWAPFAVDEPRSIQISPDGGTVYVACSHEAQGQDKIWKINVANGNTTQVHSREGVVDLLRLSPDGSTLVFETIEDGEVALYTVPVSGGAATKVTLPSRNGSLAWTNDGRLAYWRGDTGDESPFPGWSGPVMWDHLYVVNPGNGNAAAIEAGDDPVRSLEGSGGDIDFTADRVAAVCGTDEGSWSNGNRLCISKNGGPVEEVDFPARLDGFEYVEGA